MFGVLDPSHTVTQKSTNVLQDWGLGVMPVEQMDKMGP